MHFFCVCGNRIVDQTDFLAYKACLLPDQDYEDFWNQIDEIVDDESMSHKERVKKRFACSSMGRNLYQCPVCGRIIIDDPQDCTKLHFFRPEDDMVNKRLLVSGKGAQWQGILRGDWLDEKKSWMEHKGYIEAICNQSYDECTSDDKETFLRRYYEIFEDMLKKNIIRSALLKVNGQVEHAWKME